MIDFNWKKPIDYLALQTSCEMRKKLKCTVQIKITFIGKNKEHNNWMAIKALVINLLNVIHGNIKWKISQVLVSGHESVCQNGASVFF